MLSLCHYSVILKPVKNLLFAFLAIKDIKKGDPSDLRPQDDKGQSNGVILKPCEESPTFLSSSILKGR
jgi:hypothetical protein